MTPHKINFLELSFAEIVNQFIADYVTDFGEEKATQITEKVVTSDKISGFISTAGYKLYPLNENMILECINSIPYFIFSRGQTQALAGLLTLWRWHNNVNISNQIMSEMHLKVVAIAIIRKSEPTYC